jgi:hypothetical protein
MPIPVKSLNAFKNFLKVGDNFLVAFLGLRSGYALLPIDLILRSLDLLLIYYKVIKTFRKPNAIFLQ